MSEGETLDNEFFFHGTVIYRPQVAHVKEMVFMETPPDFSHASYAIIRSESISQGGMSLPSMKRMKLLRVEV